MKNIYALVDCNNFYASCERVFNPSLRKRPVVILSNNDGCVIARSEEAKTLGIKMAQPIFECWDLVKKHDIEVYSSNFVLYGDMSQRVMHVLSNFADSTEVYSIDEAFLLFEKLKAEDSFEWGVTIRSKVKQITGLPVSVGMAGTKTLAKLANHIAKRENRSIGVFCLLDYRVIDNYLKRIPVEKVWGIGRRKGKWLRHKGIDTAYKLKNAPDGWVRKHLTVTGLRTVHELRGVSCIPLEKVPPAKKAIATTRSFGYKVTNVQDMVEAVGAYTARTSEKLRKQNSIAGYMQVFIESNPFKPDKYYSNSISMTISPKTAYTPRLIFYAQHLVKKIYRQGFAYKKAGVILSRFSQVDREQYHLFDEEYGSSRKQRLMDTVDRINMDTGNIFFAGEGLGKPWYMRQTRKSKRCTTRWEELTEINI